MSSENVGISDMASCATNATGDNQAAAKCAEYFKKMNPDEEGVANQCLAIMCKMGPSTEDVDVIQQMIEAGMTIALISTKDQPDHETIKETVRKIREATDNVSKNLNMMYPLAIALKLKGVEVYTGPHEDGEDSVIQLETGDEVMLTLDPLYKGKSNRDVIYIDYPFEEREGLDLKPNHRVLLNRGEIKLKLIETDFAAGNFKCKVVHGGSIRARATVTVPDSAIEAKRSVSEDDIKDIKLALELTLDIILLRFTQSAQDIEKVRNVLKENNSRSRMLVCGSVMDHVGFQNIDEIIHAADGIEIVRGYLGANAMSWNFLLASRSIICKCRALGKPSIYTARFLSGTNKDEQMPLLSDVANAAQVVLEGADCFGLNVETALGKHPVQDIKHLVAICKEANKHVSREELLNDISSPMIFIEKDLRSVDVTAVTLSLRLNSAAIIVLTTTGESAFRISQLRPLCPIIAVTRVGHVSRQLRLFKYVHSLHYLKAKMPVWIQDIDSRIQFGVVYGKHRGFIKAGDSLIVMHGSEHGSGFTNTIRLMFATGPGT